MRRASYVLVFAFLALVLAVPMGCRQVLGIEEPPTASVEDGAVPETSSDAHDDAEGSTPDAGSDAASCGDACPIEILADGLGQAISLAVDSTNVYFADDALDDGTVYQCPKAGCPKAPLLLGSAGGGGLTVDATRVYWGDFFGDKIKACSIGGCNNAPTSIAGTQVSPHLIVADGTNLYWNANGSIMTCVPSNCGSPKVLATGQMGVGGLAADSNVATWTNNVDGVVSCPAAGCASPKKVAAGSGSVAVSGDLTAWVSGNAVMACTTPTCANPKTIGASSQPSGLATDGVYVYWRDTTEQKVLRCHRTGCTGAAEVVATNQPGVGETNVAVDGAYVYWTNAEQILRRHK